MALMERVATLLRANLNDLMDRAEDPEKTIRQLVLDMENQLLQVKTQVAIALTDQHLLEKRLREQADTVADWHRRAELAVSKGEDALARAALERALAQEQLLGALQHQLSDQAAEAEALHTTYSRLQSKLAEARTQGDLLLAEHRRARVAARGAAATGVPDETRATTVRAETIRRLQDRLTRTGNPAVRTDPQQPSLEERFAALERTDRVEELLAELKSRHLLPAD